MADMKSAGNRDPRVVDIITKGNYIMGLLNRVAKHGKPAAARDVVNGAREALDDLLNDVLHLELQDLIEAHRGPSGEEASQMLADFCAIGCEDPLAKMIRKLSGCPADRDLGAHLVHLRDLADRHLEEFPE